MHIGSTQDHTMMDAGLSLLSVGCFPNQGALLHCGPSITDSRKQLKHRISFKEIYFFWFLVVDSGSGRHFVDLVIEDLQSRM